MASSNKIDAFFMFVQDWMKGVYGVGTHDKGIREWYFGGKISISCFHAAGKIQVIVLQLRVQGLHLIAVKNCALSGAIAMKKRAKQKKEGSIMIPSCCVSLRIMQLLRIQEIVDDRLCYEKVRELSWSEGVKCPQNGFVIIRALENIQQKTIQPLIRRFVQTGSKVFTDEYNIYNWLSNFYEHKTVNHGQGEFARDEDGDGKFEAHVNTMEGFWSPLRPWLRPHRGISQERLPFYLGFFEFMHNIRKEEAML